MKLINQFNKELDQLGAKGHFLSQVPVMNLPKSLQDKLITLCLDGYYDKLSRNLKVLYENKMGE